jgi:serine/threonine-protein kinase
VEHIGPYDIVRELGAGGMGTVYEARHRTTGIATAVKVLPAALAREPGFVARFNREIESLQKLKSPNIVELYESGVDDGLYFYAMEFVEGETLTQRLEREKRIPWREVVELGVQICRALKVAHNIGIIHRDLKPSNLLLTREGQVKLTDFGVAQVFAGGRLTATGGVIGTAEYMSPEQAQGKRATKQSDVYALGAVMYVMLTGRPPFVGKTALDLAQKHRYGQFDSPKRVVPEIPSWLDDVVCKCLEKNPDDRYPDAYVLSLRLAEIPKKVDLSAAAEAAAAGEDETTAETMAEGRQSGGAVGGTFVRDVVRAEFERQTEQTPLQKALDNTWVLLALLALVIAGGFWFYQNREPPPQTLFAEGAALMEGPRGSDWVRARNEYFRPLLSRDRETWEPRIAPYLPQIELAETELELLRLIRREDDADAAVSEPKRLLASVAADLEREDFASAAARLASLRTLLGDNPDYALERQIVDNLLSKLPESVLEREDPILTRALERAARYQEAGKLTEAQRIWSAVSVLYGEDPAASEEVRAAEEALRKTSEP